MKAISMCMREGEMTPKQLARIAAGTWMTLLGNLGTVTHRYSSSVATEGSVHACCMLDLVDHIARGHTDPRLCVACQSTWPEARGLLKTEQGGRWTVVRSALQFAALLQRGDLRTEPASYVTTGVHTTFELMVSTFGRNPTSSFVLCSLFSDALDLPQEACLDFPRTGEWKAAATHYLTGDLIARHHTQTPKSETIHWTSRSSLFGGP